MGGGHRVIAEPHRRCYPLSVHEGFYIVAEQAQITEHAFYQCKPMHVVAHSAPLLLCVAAFNELHDQHGTLITHVQ